MTAAVAMLPSLRLARREQGYGWPLRPFDRVHAIRGGFGDPRFGYDQRNFHFGIDISAGGGSRVFAVAPGTVFLEPDHVDVLNGQASGFESGFSYWHIIPAVREHSFVRIHSLLGWVNPAWGHVHFSEILNGRYVNPLRPGALVPAPPPFVPTIAAIAVAPTDAGSLSSRENDGRVAIVADAYARPPLRPPAPWQHTVVAPSMIRWRLLDGQQPLSGWRTAVDFRAFLPSDLLYRDIYAPGTRPDMAGHTGKFIFYLARSWNLRVLPADIYTIQVEAVGTRGVTAFATTTLQVGDS